MNASECCQTIGCNCAGTQSVEFLSNHHWIGWVSLVIVVLVALMLFFAVWLGSRE